MTRALGRPWLLLPLLAALALGCPRIPDEPEDVAKDLAAWLVAVKSWEADERKIFDAMSAIQKSQYVQDDYTVRTLKDALPLIRNHNRQVAEYKAATLDVVDVHKQYKAGWDNLELSFHSIITAAGAKEYMKLSKAKSDMDYGRGQVLGSFALLDELLEENDLQLRQVQQRELLREQEAALARTPVPGDPPGEGKAPEAAAPAK